MSKFIEFEDENERVIVNVAFYDKIKKDKQNDKCLEFLRIRENKTKYSTTLYIVEDIFCCKNTKERDEKYNEILEKINK